MIRIGSTVKNMFPGRRSLYSMLFCCESKMLLGTPGRQRSYPNNWWGAKRETVKNKPLRMAALVVGTVRDQGGAVVPNDYQLQCVSGNCRLRADSWLTNGIPRALQFIVHSLYRLRRKPASGGASYVP